MWTTAVRKQEEQQYYLHPHSHDTRRAESVSSVLLFPVQLPRWVCIDTSGTHGSSEITQIVLAKSLVRLQLGFIAPWTIGHDTQQCMLGADLITENKSFARGARQPYGTYADPLCSTSVMWQADVMLDQLLLFLSVLSVLFRHHDAHCHKTREQCSHTKEKIHNSPDTEKVEMSCCSGEGFWKVRHGYDKILRVLQNAEMPQWIRQMPLCYPVKGMSTKKTPLKSFQINLNHKVCPVSNTP